jgi:hypothetical protein
MAGATAPAVFFGARRHVPLRSPGRLHGATERTLTTIYVPFTSRSKRGLPRSGAKLGSTRNQPGAK